jgi:hypothetical protein
MSLNEGVIVFQKGSISATLPPNPVDTTGTDAEPCGSTVSAMSLMCEVICSCRVFDGNDSSEVRRFVSVGSYTGSRDRIKLNENVQLGSSTRSSRSSKVRVLLGFKAQSRSQQIVLYQAVHIQATIPWWSSQEVDTALPFSSASLRNCDRMRRSRWSLNMSFAALKCTCAGTGADVLLPTRPRPAR